MFWKSKKVVNEKKNRVGFTLAEVLITLTIIGAVAAIGIPALISRNDDFLVVNGLKRAHSTLTHLGLMARANNELDGCAGIDCAKTLIGAVKVGRECARDGACIELEYADGSLLYNRRNYVVAQGGMIYAWNDVIEVDGKTKYVSIGVVPNIKKVDYRGNVNQYTFWLDVEDARIFPAGSPNLPEVISLEHESSLLSRETVCPDVNSGCAYWTIKTGHIHKKAGEWYSED